jgi:hexosaminidase
MAQDKLPALIPYPQKIEFNSSQFQLRSDTEILIDRSDQNLCRLASYLEKILIKNASDPKKKTRNRIELRIDSSLQTRREAYCLNVGNRKLEIVGKDPAGVFYGIQTLKQLLADGSVVPGVSITDQPRFAYRGLHLDVCRHFFSTDFVKKFIDAMAFYKYNTLHWHLTEDQGWRIEIKKYPKLTETGSKRDRTIMGHLRAQPRKYDNKPVEGFYTQEEIKEIVSYAEERHITIIPEIELPGHATAALASYPHLGCAGEGYKVQDTWGIFSTIFCAGKETTFEFLEDVMDEVCELFPSEYIHIGGDEARKHEWDKCPLCKKRIEEEGLEDSHELQSYFIKRMEKYINAKGRSIIGWGEILEGGLAPNATVMSWKGMKAGIEAAKMNHDAIMTPGSHCYFDKYQGEKEHEPLAIGGYVPLRRVYEFNPIPKELPAEKHKFIIGAQGNLWSEYIPTADHMEYMAYPRACALAEVLWSAEKKESFDEFKRRLKVHYHFLDEMGINYHNKEK